jgi:hypothetical protein
MVVRYLSRQGYSVHYKHPESTASRTGPVLVSAASSLGLQGWSDLMGALAHAPLNVLSAKRGIESDDSSLATRGVYGGVHG